MLQILAIIALLLNGVGVCYAVLSCGGAGWRQWRADRRGNADFVLAVVLLIAAIIACNVSSVSLGVGMLVGGCCAFILLLVTGTSASTLPLQVGVLAAAGVGPALLLVVFPHDPASSMIGCAVGGLLITVLAGATMAKDSGATSLHALGLFAVTMFVVVAGVLLAIAHFPQSAGATLAGGYWAVSPLLLGGGALTALLCSSSRDGNLFARKPLLVGCSMALGMTLISMLLQWKVLPALAWQLPLYGTLAFAGILAVMTAEEHISDGTDYRPLLLTFMLLLLGLAVAVIGFRRLQGFGEILTLLPLPALLGAISLDRPQGKCPLAYAIGMGALLVLLIFSASRLLLENGTHTYPLDFQRQYDFLALLLGIAGTLGVMATLARMEQATSTGWSTLIRSLLPQLLLILCAAAVPVALIVLWGSRTVLAFILGVAAGGILWMTMAAWTASAERERGLRSAPHLYLLIALLSALYFVHLHAGHTYTRPTKIVVLLLLIGMATLMVLLETWWHRPIAASFTAGKPVRSISPIRKNK